MPVLFSDIFFLAVVTSGNKEDQITLFSFSIRSTDVVRVPTLKLFIDQDIPPPLSINLEVPFCSFECFVCFKPTQRYWNQDMQAVAYLLNFIQSLRRDQIESNYNTSL